MIQADYVKTQLAPFVPGASFEIIPIRTSGDKLSSASLARVGGKGLFIRELEQALADGRIDLAVHSMKDLPARMPPGFALAAVPARADVRDVLVSASGASFTALRSGARVGTSSMRRRFQALRARPELEIVALRGNVDTRLKQVATGALDAIIIAAAGLGRLGRAADVNCTILDPRDFIPAGGQGALAIETREHLINRSLASGLAAFEDRRARLETSAEREFLATIGASCVTPIGVNAVLKADYLMIRTILFSSDGARELADSIDCVIAANADTAAALRAVQDAGARLGERMLARGAKELLGDE